MRAILLCSTAVLVLQAAAPCPLEAQDSGEGFSQVDLRDGGSIYGRVIGRGERVRIVVESGDTIDLPAAQVERVREVQGRMIDGRFFRADPNETRLFLGPTARTLPAGSAYLGVFELYLPFVGYGVTDNITIAGGAPLIFGDGMPLILYVAPKVQLFRSGGLSGAVGSLSFFIPDEANFGIVYGVMTAEARDGSGSLTLGGGQAYAGDEMADGLAIMVGGDLRVSRSLKLLSENYVIAGEDAQLFSFGLRFIGERLSADVGLAMPGEGGIALPLVNFVYSF